MSYVSIYLDCFAVETKTEKERVCCNVAALFLCVPNEIWRDLISQQFFSVSEWLSIRRNLKCSSIGFALLIQKKRKETNRQKKHKLSFDFNQYLLILLFKMFSGDLQFGFVTLSLATVFRSLVWLFAITSLCMRCRFRFLLKTFSIYLFITTFGFAFCFSFCIFAVCFSFCYRMRSKVRLDIFLNCVRFNEMEWERNNHIKTDRSTVAIQLSFSAFFFFLFRQKCVHLF